MGLIKKLSSIMVHTTAYRLWQAPFSHAKLAPVLRHNEFKTIQKVLDVGCGPGTNCLFFKEADYTGFDINPEYIHYARKRYKRNFLVQDVCTFEAVPGQEFDFVLMNSLLHHLNEDDTHRILEQVGRLIASNGFVHIIDLVLPDQRGIPRWLANSDRGDFPRPLSSWDKIFSAHFETSVFEPYPIRLFGIELWNLVYFKGGPKS